MGLLPIGASTIEKQDAKAEVSGRMPGGSVNVALFDPQTSQPLRFGLGVAGVWLNAVGEASPPLKGRPTSAVIVMPYSSADISMHLFSDTFLTGGMLMGVSLPKADIKFAGQKVGTWGRPAMMVFLGATSVF